MIFDGCVPVAQTHHDLGGTVLIRPKKWIGSTILSILIGVTGAASAQGQASSGIIQGKISDSQQLAMAHTGVEIQDDNGKTIGKTTSDDTGRYEFDSLAPGK